MRGCALCENASASSAGEIYPIMAPVRATRASDVMLAVITGTRAIAAAVCVAEGKREQRRL